MKGRVWIGYLLAPVAAFVLYLPFMYLMSFDFESVGYMLALALATLLVAIVVFVRALARKPWPSFKYLIAGVLFWAISIFMFFNTQELRPWARWTFESGKYKQSVLRQEPDRQTGLRHIEWDGWGWAGIDTSVELVYDPSDSLRENLKSSPGIYGEIATRTAKVQKLAKGWYSVTLFTNEVWP